MTSKTNFRIRKGRRTMVQRTIGDHELTHKLDEYEGFVRWKARRWAWKREDRKDFEQIGREAVVKVFSAIQGGRKVRSEKSYYLNSITNAMIDYYRTERRPNYAVWKYDRKSGPTRVKRYRYRDEWKGRIQYHGDKLKRVGLQHRNSLDLEEVPPHSVGFFETFSCEE